MEASNRACVKPVSGIPVSYIEVMYIRHNILSTISNSLCLTSSLCSTTERGI
jgi:hypothetical protein